MIPLVLSALLGKLAENGLGMIASAVTAKGKAAIESTLGVDLDKETQTLEGRERLLRLQHEHEGKLQEFAIAKAAQDLEARAQEFADTDSARSMNARAQESANASGLSKNIAPILALIVVVGGGALLALSPEEGVRTAAVGLITSVLGFYFGSTKSSQTKDDTIRALGGLK